MVCKRRVKQHCFSPSTMHFLPSFLKPVHLHLSLLRWSNVCIEDVEHLKFKLWMFWIPIHDDGKPAHILGDNNSLVTNTSNVESSVNKKNSSIAYHFSRWNVAVQECVCVRWLGYQQVRTLPMLWLKDCQKILGIICFDDGLIDMIGWDELRIWLPE